MLERFGSHEALAAGALLTCARDGRPLGGMLGGTWKSSTLARRPRFPMAASRLGAHGYGRIHVRIHRSCASTPSSQSERQEYGTVCTHGSKRKANAMAWQ